jgi:hypothetical protein
MAMNRHKREIHKRLANLCVNSALRQLESNPSWRILLKEAIKALGNPSNRPSEEVFVKSLLVHYSYLHTPIVSLTGPYTGHYIRHQIAEDNFLPSAYLFYTDEFKAKRNGDYYEPTVAMRTVKSRFAKLHATYSESEMLKKWEKIAGHLVIEDPVSHVNVAPKLRYRPRHSNQHVYFCYSKQHHIIKIGITDNLERRLKEIRSEYKVHDAEYIYVEHFAGKELEQDLHSRFDSLNIKNNTILKTEWFECNPVIDEAIASLSNYSYVIKRDEIDYDFLDDDFVSERVGWVDGEMVW